jgi:hypothetical protein
MGITSAKGEALMLTYLTKVGSTYYFRRVVPDELQGFFRTASGKPRHEFKVSLRTKDRRVAERLGRLKAVETDEQFDEAAKALTAQAAFLLTKPVPAQAMSAGEIEQMEFNNQRDFIEQQGWEAREGMRQGWVKAAFAAGASPELRAVRDVIDESFLRSPAEQAAIETKRAAEWKEGARQFALTLGDNKPPIAAAKYPRLMSLFDGYLLEAKPQPATVKRWRPVIAHFIKFLGHDDASRVTAEDVVRWKQLLLQMRLLGPALLF